MSLADELRAAATQCDHLALEAVSDLRINAAHTALETAALFCERAGHAEALDAEHGRTVVDDMVDTRVRELMDALERIEAGCSFPAMSHATIRAIAREALQ